MGMMLIVVALLMECARSEWVTGRTWTSKSDFLPDDGFVFPEAKKDCGMAFSGGGSRAFSLALSQMSELSGKDCVISGISGGSWAVAVHRYGNVPLGVSSSPEQLSLRKLEYDNSESARSFPSKMMRHILEKTNELRNESLARVWREVVYETYVKPCGLERNSSMANDKFSIFGISAWTPDKSEHGMIEATPLYVGQAAGSSFQGGYLFEQQLFDCSIATDKGGEDCSGLSLTDAISASSWAPGDLIASFRLFGLAEGWRVRYRNEFVELADGGAVENTHLSGLIQRGITRLYGFFNTVTPLDSVSVADDLAAFFGVFDRATPQYNYSSMQIFPRKDFEPLVEELRKSKERGFGAVATFQHTTIENSLLGIEAGVEVNVTWCYLTTARKWFERLPTTTQMKINLDPRFRHFPHFSTSRLDLGLAEVNALSSLASFVVANNPQHFS